MTPQRCAQHKHEPGLPRRVGGWLQRWFARRRSAAAVAPCCWPEPSPAPCPASPPWRSRCRCPPARGSRPPSAPPPRSFSGAARPPASTPWRVPSARPPPSPSAARAGPQWPSPPRPVASSCPPALPAGSAPPSGPGRRAWRPPPVPRPCLCATPPRPWCGPTPPPPAVVAAACYASAVAPVATPWPAHGKAAQGASKHMSTRSRAAATGATAPQRRPHLLDVAHLLLRDADRVLHALDALLLGFHLRRQRVALSAHLTQLQRRGRAVRVSVSVPPKRNSGNLRHLRHLRCAHLLANSVLFLPQHLHRLLQQLVLVLGALAGFLHLPLL